MRWEIIVVIALVVMPHAAAAEPGFLKDIGPGEDRQDRPQMAVFVAMIIVAVFLVGYVLHNPIDQPGRRGT